MAATGTAIWWIRRDLRLTDNEALTAAIRRRQEVLPVFILDPAFESMSTTAEKRWAFLFGGLHRLDQSLRRRGSYLVVRRGRPEQVLTELLAATGADLILAEEDVSNYARARDAHVAASLPFEHVGSVAVRPPGTVLKADGDPYIVFTPFKNTWKGQPLPHRRQVLEAPDSITTPPDVSGEPVPELPGDGTELFPPGEAEAQRRLEAFRTHCIAAYDEQRDRLSVDGTSRLSPYFRFGMLSPRQAAAAAVQSMAESKTPEAKQGARSWLDELVWRDFYLHILYHFPHVSRTSFREEYRALPWRNNREEFDAWRAGRTGYPIVDAAMRQMAAIGWMHNRARMIVASFLVKDLLVDWRWGERWFMQSLVDGDPAANNGGWQWSAGTGTDAAPYFRIFNPTAQGEKFDPAGNYIRQWVPELAPVPDEYIHAPWKMPPLIQREVGCIMGRDYPAPIVDHKQARQRTLDAYKRAREAANA